MIDIETFLMSDLTVSQFIDLITQLIVVVTFFLTIYIPIAFGVVYGTVKALLFIGNSLADIHSYQLKIAGNRLKLSASPNPSDKEKIILMVLFSLTEFVIGIMAFLMVIIYPNHLTGITLGIYMLFAPMITLLLGMLAHHLIPNFLKATD